MRHILAIILSICIFFCASPARYSLDYKGKKISEAIADFCRKNPEANVSFIYNELEDYTVKGLIESDNTVEALRQLVFMNPVTVVSDGSRIYIESMQKGKYRYSGRTVSSDNYPVAFATVVLLNPKDSTVVTYGSADANGRFCIPCDRKDVIAKFSSIGYKTRAVRPGQFDMREIVLEILPIELKNVTATADARYALSDRTVFIPTAREKKAAQGGADLLMLMSLPNVRVGIADKSISTISGEGITVFIDYVKASAQELAVLRPDDVKKVEVIDYPSDPRLLGVRHAVNFIMEKYEYGGYTKLSDRQRLDFRYGYYSLASKFNYGKMTYDIYTGHDHFSSDDEYANSTAEYDFRPMKLTVDRSTLDSRVRNDESYVSARARYSDEKNLISNQVSLRYNTTPCSSATVRNTYSPSLYPSGNSYSSSSRRSLTPSWKGTFNFIFPHSISVSVTPSATFAKNSSCYEFSEEGTNIFNDVSEKAWNANLNAGISKNWNRQSITLYINGELAGNKLHYTGENPADINYRWESVGCHLSANLSFGKFWLQPSGKFYFSRTRFDNRNFTQPLPGYYIAAGWNPSKKHKVSVSSEMSQWTIGVSQRSPNIVVRNLIEAVQGNPSLKTWRYNSAQIDYTWIPFQWFYIGAYGSYIRHTKPIDFRYTPTEIGGREMMLRTYVKDGYFQNIETGLSATARLLGNSLILRGDISFNSLKRGGSRSYSRNVLNGSVSATGYAGDFFFQGTYQFRNKSASAHIVKSDSPSYYVLSAGWSKKGWNIQAEIRNVFRSSHLKLTEYTAYENYIMKGNYFGSAYRRQFWISATYTVSYGKKVKVEGIGRGSSVSSGIVD